jgi:Leucine-rich repeat (LRR) protein
MKKKLLLLLAVLMTAMVAQAATDYGFTVAGTTVTSDNCNNIVSNYITSGTVYYVPSSNTLYMNNVTITMTGDYNRVINNLECSGLKVQFSGTCNLYARDAAVVRIRKNTTLSAPSASTVVNITGVNQNGIWMATSNEFSLTIQGPGTFNIKSTNNTALEDEDDGSGIQLDTWHQVYFDNVNAVLSSGGNSVVKRVSLRFKAGSSVRFKATNNSSYPVINYCAWQLYGNEALLEPYGAYYDGSYVVDSNGNRVYNKDVYVSDDYVAIINATNFPDANFRSWLLENFPGYIHDGHVNNWGVFNLSGKNISNLKGIEYFTNLSSLNISNNNLTSVDLSHNTNLEDLYCSNNQLTSLNLSNLTNLEILDCSNNKLTTLSTSDKSYLKTLNCSSNTLLTTLFCYRCDLTTLNVTGCTALKDLRCYENASLTAITGLANCAAITYLDCEDCAITSLPGVNSMSNIATLLARNNKLTALTVANKSKLATLRVGGNTTLASLACNNNALTTLDVSGCTGLTELFCYENANLAAITGLANCTAITYLDCEDCAITDLTGVNNMTNIATLLARNNKLASLAINYKGSLVTLRVSGNTTLTTLSCCRNALTSLNITGCTGLKELRCYENANLTTITGLADCTAITYLDCEDCKISDLSAVNTMTNIQKIYARNNKLTTFAVTGKSDLTYLRVSGNQSLTTLQCANNALTTLDFTNCPALTHASCAGNSLTSLTVTGCTSLKNLFCNRNRISGTAMTNLVNSLPTRTASDPGNFNVLNNTNENNVITAAQLAIARGKYWNPKKWNGSDWVDLTVSTRGDVNGDGTIDINDVTRLIDVVLGKSVTYDAVAADCNTATGNGSVDINDVTALINYVLSGSW